MTNLPSLTLRDGLSCDKGKMFTNQETTDLHEHPITWLFPGLTNKSLRNLRLEGFEVNHSDVKDTSKTLLAIHPPVTTLTLVDWNLIPRKEDEQSVKRKYHAACHILGHTWEFVCHCSATFRPERRLKLVRLLSNIQVYRTFRLHATVAKKISRCYKPVEFDLHYLDSHPCGSATDSLVITRQS